MFETCRKIVLALLLISGVTPLSAQQCIECGDGSSGSFDATQDTILKGGIYYFEEFIIQQNVKVLIRGENPLIIYCKGFINIQGILDASGENGGDGLQNLTGGKGYAGGFNGADGIYTTQPIQSGNSGFGPGSGNGGINSGGSGAGYASNGIGCTINGGLTYGDAQLTNQYGGSGGGSGFATTGCGSGAGGAGGGFIHLNSCAGIIIGENGSILSNGGDGGSGQYCSTAGGGGSGGSIRISSRFIDLKGRINALGGFGGNPLNSLPCSQGGNGSEGRIRIDYHDLYNDGIILPTPFTKALFNAGIRRVVDTKCYNTPTGFIKARASGGEKPYNYLWSTGSTNEEIVNLQPGFYTVTITDANGCSVVQQAEVNQPSQIQSEITTYPPTCSQSGDAVVLANTTGGNPFPYKKSLATTLWSNTSCNGLMFDFQVDITAKLNYLTLQLPDTGLQQISVYFKTGTMVQHEFNPNDWQLISSTAVNGSGSDDETPIDLSNLPLLTPGRYSFYIYNHQSPILCVSNNVLGSTFNFDHVISLYQGTGRGSSSNIFQAPVTSTMNLGGRISYEVPSSSNAPYSYSAGTLTGAAISGLSPGSHNITIKDALGCSVQKTILIDTPSEPTITNATVQSPKCHDSNDGSILINANPGTITRYASTQPPVTLPVNGSFIQISSTYDAILEAIDLYTLTNGTIEIYTKSGGYSGFENNSSVWTSLGNYTVNTAANPVRIQLNNLQLLPAGTNSIYIYSPDGIIKNADSASTFIQNGLLLSRSSAAIGNQNPFNTTVKSNAYFAGTLIYKEANSGLNYLWSNNSSSNQIQQLSAGTYTLTVSQGNACKTSAVYQLNAPSPITVSSSTSPENDTENDGAVTIHVDGGIPPYYIQWPNGVTGQHLSQLSAGDYPVFIADLNGCVLRDTIRISRFDTPIKTEGWLTIQPNPGQGFIKVSEEVKGMSDCEMSLFDHLGRLILKQQTNISTLMTTGLNLSHLSDGNYILQVRDSDQLFHARAIIIR